MEEIQIGKTYILNSENPFSEVFAIPVEIKSNYVRYHYIDSPEYSESLRVEDFLKFYQIEKESNE